MFRSLRQSKLCHFIIVVCVCVLINQYQASLRSALNPRVRRRFSTSSSSYSSSSSSSSQNAQSLNLKFNTAVAYHPKERDENKLINKFYTYKKIESPTGEDNFVITANNSSSLIAGVADGVGGWAEAGFDSSAISRELCANIKHFWLQDTSLAAVDYLDKSFSKINTDKIVKVGGTTACLGKFSPDGTLNIANLGDSWCGVFRNSKLIFNTKNQEHAFNTPYQLAVIPQQLLEKNSNYIRDSPKDADEYSFQLQPNDIVIFATDGVTDNIFPQDIEIFLNDNNAKPLQNLADELVDNVYKLSIDEQYPSVFAQQYSQIYGRRITGGKEDDITIVLVKPFIESKL